MTQTRNLPKSAISVLDIGINWGDWLNTGDTVVLSEWAADPEITISRQQMTTTTTSCYIAGGVDGKIYKIYNKITTANDLIESRFITVSIEENSV